MNTKNTGWVTAALALTFVVGIWVTPAQADHRERGGLLGAVLDRVLDDERPEHEERLGKGRGGGKGPPFCRSGAGHPVHGRQWCHEKGFGLGHSGHHDRDRGVLGDVILGR